MNELLAELTRLSGLGETGLWSAALVFLRVGGAMALIPAFGDQTVPQRVRLVLSLGFTLIVAPSVWDRVPQVGFVLPLVSEAAAGLILGLALRLFIMALQTAAMMIAQATSLSQLLGGVGPEPQPAIGHMMVMASLALAVQAGLHIKVVSLLILSYDMLPPGQMPGSGAFAQWGIWRVAEAFSLAFTLAAPFTIASLLYNVALGVINRAMPSLMVSLIGAPALALGSLALLALILPIVLQVWMGHFEGFLGRPFEPPP